MHILLFLIILMLTPSFSFAIEEIINGQITDSQEDVTKLAFATLSQFISADEKDLVLIRLSRFEWPNSALGCPKPGVMYTQATVPGHMALLKHGTKLYRVHLGQGRGIVCDLPRMPLNVDVAILDNLKKLATQDLADKLGVESQDIAVVEDQSKVWPDTSFGCPADSDSSVAKKIRGYLLKLEHQGRSFEYRTSRSKVKPCPPIETE